MCSSCAQGMNESIHLCFQMLQSSLGNIQETFGTEWLCLCCQAVSLLHLSKFVMEVFPYKNLYRAAMNGFKI
jgi:hypothetical protein